MEEGAPLGHGFNRRNDEKQFRVLLFENLCRLQKYRQQARYFVMARSRQQTDDLLSVFNVVFAAESFPVAVDDRAFDYRVADKVGCQTVRC